VKAAMRGFRASEASARDLISTRLEYIWIRIWMNTAASFNAVVDLL